MADILDLTVKSETRIRLTKGISYTNLTWNMDAPPAAFTITMRNWNEGNDQTWTVGSGISIVDENVIWNVGTIVADSGTYYGSIESDNDVYGNAFRSRITIIVE